MREAGFDYAGEYADFDYQEKDGRVEQFDENKVNQLVGKFYTETDESFYPGPGYEYLKFDDFEEIASTSNEARLFVVKTLFECVKDNYTVGIRGGFYEGYRQNDDLDKMTGRKLFGPENNLLKGLSVENVIEIKSLIGADKGDCVDCLDRYFDEIIQKDEKNIVDVYEKCGVVSKIALLNLLRAFVERCIDDERSSEKVFEYFSSIKRAEKSAGLLLIVDQIEQGAMERASVVDGAYVDRKEKEFARISHDSAFLELSALSRDYEFKRVGKDFTVAFKGSVPVMYAKIDKGALDKAVGEKRFAPDWHIGGYIESGQFRDAIREMTVLLDDVAGVDYPEELIAHLLGISVFDIENIDNNSVNRTLFFRQLFLTLNAH